MNDIIEILDFSEKENKPGLFYCYLSVSSFVEQDIKSFQESFSVKLFPFQPSHKLLLPVFFIKQLLFLLWNSRSTSIFVCQFAGYHSFLPVVISKILHKISVIVVGGTDCVSMPSIGYGNLRKLPLRWFTLKSLKYTKHIISPSTSLIECDYTYSNNDFPNQGYRFFDKSIITPVTVIFNGIDTNRFNPVPDSVRRKNTFLTVCTKIDNRNFYLKGIDLFIEMARHFPECEFTIIGRVTPGFYFSGSPNVTFIDYLSPDSLPSKMSEFTFYCQLSMSEGFGVALAEAMACGCIPIVSKVGIMDFIIGDSGFILEKHDAGLLQSLFSKAIGADIESLTKKARNRVVELFNIQIRKSALQRLINDLI